MAERRRLGLAQGVFVALAAVVVLAIFLTPTTGENRGTLTTHSPAPGGAAGLQQLLERLGWQSARRTTPYAAPVARDVVHAVLDPQVPPTSGEVHALLEAVRGGAGLLVVVQPDTPLADSLGLARSEEGGVLAPAAAGLCPDSLNRMGLIQWPDGMVHSWWLTRYPAAGATAFALVRPEATVTIGGRRDTLRPPPFDTAATLPTAADTLPRERTTATLRRGLAASWRPAMLGFRLGAGRVVAVADPDLLRNDVLRVCRWDAGFAAARALDWLAEGRTRQIAFAEFHHGYGTHAAPVGTVARVLVGTAPGRAVLALVAAALVLLAAHAVRPIAPLPRHVVERRSPLEHVDALASAYARVGAGRLATRRLVRGLRRRHALGVDRTGDDVAWLHRAATRRPSLAADAARLERALAGPVDQDALAAVGAAVARFDDQLRPDRDR